MKGVRGALQVPHKKTPMYSLLLCLAWLAFSPVGANAQTTKTDTLFYFHPDSLNNECTGVLLSLTYYAIYYEIGDQIDSYNLKELHMQFCKGLTLDVIPLPPSFSLDVQIGELDSLPEQGLQIDSLPGEVIATIPITFNDSTELYPNWKIVPLDTFPELHDLTGSFWLEGYPMSWTTWDTSRSIPGHSFRRIYPEINCWSTGPGVREWAVKAVIEYSSLGTDDDPDNIPKMYQLYQNYPNPFNSQTIIADSAPGQSAVSITIYDVLGREVRNLRGHADKRGLKNYVIWDGKDNSAEDVPSGVYLYSLRVFSQVNGPTKTKKLLLLR